MNKRRKVVLVSVVALFLGVASLYYHQEKKRKAYVGQQQYLEWIRPFSKHLPDGTEVISVRDVVDEREKVHYTKIITHSKSPLVMLNRTENGIEIAHYWREPLKNYKLIQKYLPGTELGELLSSGDHWDNSFSWDKWENRKTHWNTAFVETTNGFYTWWVRVVSLCE